MSYIKSGQTQSGEKVKIYYQDLGEGPPVVLIHGWPLSHEMWEYQLNTLIEGGFRVIAYDRRGFGKSSKPWNGYDYDSLTQDLKALIETLDLRDVTLVGFSMGGGEAVRYLSRYGAERISKLVLLGSVTPFMLKTAATQTASISQYLMTSRKAFKMTESIFSIPSANNSLA